MPTPMKTSNSQKQRESSDEPEPEHEHEPEPKHGEGPVMLDEQPVDLVDPKDEGKGEQAAADAGPDLVKRVQQAVGRDRVGGVAPFLDPASRMGRRLRLREMRTRGFVALSPGKPRLHQRILPRSVIGICLMLLCMAIGAAFSGAAFYAYYDDRLAENERTVARFVDGFDQQFTDAAGAIDKIRLESIDEVRYELRSLHDFVADADGVVNLPQVAGDSIWMLETRDDDGEIITGSAFAIVPHNGGTALVTSYAMVAASTVAPSPAMDLVKGNRRVPAQLWSWDEEHDLALVVVDEVIPPLQFASDTAQVATVGARVFALSGVGGQGATASPGVLLDNSLAGLQHTAPVGTLFRGGPLLNGDGNVIGVATLDYQPFGIEAGDVRQAPDVRAICRLVLECSEIREEIEVEVSSEEADAPLREDLEPVRRPSELANVDDEAEADADAELLDGDQFEDDQTEGDQTEGDQTEGDQSGAEQYGEDPSDGDG